LAESKTNSTPRGIFPENLSSIGAVVSEELSNK